MLRKSKSRAQEPEEVGKQIARELRQIFEKNQAGAKAEERECARMREINLRIRMALVRAVDGYNDHAPRKSHLAVLDRGDRLLFSAAGRVTLTLRYGSDEVVIESSGVEAHGVGPMAVAVWQGLNKRDRELRFQAVPDAPVFPWKILNERQFVYCVLRMACNHRFAELPNC